MKKRQYFRIYNDIAKQYNLKGVESDIFFLILSFTRSGMQCSYSQETLSSMFKCSRVSINKSFRALKKKRLIKEVQTDYNSKSWIVSESLVSFSKKCKKHYYNRHFDIIEDLSSKGLQHSRQTVYEIIRSFEDADIKCTRKDINRLTVYGRKTVNDSLSDLKKQHCILETVNTGKSKTFKTIQNSADEKALNFEDLLKMTDPKNR